MLDIRDCLEAGDLLAGLANPQSFRSYIESLKDDELFKDHGEDRSDTRSFSLVVAVDEKENVDVWFEDWVEDFDQEEEYATVSISPKTWQGVCDATATLDHLWS